MDHGRAYFYPDYVELLLDFPEYNSLIATKQQRESVSKGVSTEYAPKHENGLADEVNDNNPRTLEDAMEKSMDTGENMFWKFYGAGTNLFFVAIMIFLFVLTQVFVCSNDLFVLVL